MIVRLGDGGSMTGEERPALPVRLDDRVIRRGNVLFEPGEQGRPKLKLMRL
jgi:hypothetical protein